ncbi:MAG: aldolase/citrate lyase family protein [Spirochaetes bacterium]|nr:aldolase/citrate lyase family protein [Spirochaetota bacterium]
MTFNELQDKLLNLKQNHSLVGLKAGTEVESMNFDEIYLMKQLSDGILPLTVKIGGPEARNDVIQCIKIGVDNILAPMIESPYGLKNFAKAVSSIDINGNMKLCINIETIYAYRNFLDIIKSPYFQYLDRVTIGRSDLAASLELHPDNPDVMQITKDIVMLSKKNHKKTSVGGTINIMNAKSIQNEICPDYINSRHMILDAFSIDINFDIQKALQWEIDFYCLLKNHFPHKKPFYQMQIHTLEKRLNFAFSPK